MEIQKGVGKDLAFLLDLELDLASSPDWMASDVQLTKILLVMPEIPAALSARDAEPLVTAIDFVLEFLGESVELPEMIAALTCACFRDETMLTDAKLWQSTGELKFNRLGEAWEGILDEMMTMVSSTTPKDAS